MERNPAFLRALLIKPINGATREYIHCTLRNVSKRCRDMYIHIYMCVIPWNTVLFISDFKSEILHFVHSLVSIQFICFDYN